MEFAIVAPLLFLLVFGIIDFGWAFYQHLDVRHGARESARLAVVNYHTSSGPCAPGGVTSCNDARLTQLLTEACGRMDDGLGLEVQLTRADSNGNGTDYEPGDKVVAQVRKAPVDQLTGFLAPFLDGVDVTSRVDMRIEQSAQWTDMGSTWHTCV